MPERDEFVPQLPTSLNAMLSDERKVAVDSLTDDELQFEIARGRGISISGKASRLSLSSLVHKFGNVCCHATLQTSR